MAKTEFCTKCGSRISSDDKFCKNCGESLTENTTNIAKSQNLTYRKVSIAKLISLIIGLIIVLFGFVFLFAGGSNGGGGAIVGLFLAVLFWVIGGIFVYIGRNAIETTSEKKT